MSDQFVERRDGAIVGVYANPQPGIAEEPVAEDDPELVAFLAPPPAPILVSYGAFRARWQPKELQALFEAEKTSDLGWQIHDFTLLASSQGHVNLSGPMAAAARDLFVALGVLTAERAEAIFAAD